MLEHVEVDMDTILVSMYNSSEDVENKVFLNDEDFFVNTFETPYDAAWAVSLSGRWRRSDSFVYFDEDGCLVSFSHWDDVRSPIDLDKIDICQHKNGYVVNNISKAIHDAFQKE